MIQYEVSCDSPNQHYIRFKASFPVTKELTTLHLSAWRPGRYELGNFAKNVREFIVFGAENKPLSFKKTNKNSWEIQTENTKEIVVEYAYFAAELNAGSSFLDETQLYVNPVNCFLFSEDLKDEPYRIKLHISDEWKIACSLTKQDKVLEAANYEELADSPFICSADLAHDSYEIQGIKFHIWIIKNTSIGNDLKTIS
jgi:predicted metalloprotease with PDZ domain